MLCHLSNPNPFTTVLQYPPRPLFAFDVASNGKNTNIYIECSHQKKMSGENWESTMMSYHTSATTAATFSLGTIKNRGGGWWNRWSIPFSYCTIYPSSSSSSSSYHQIA
jgi:hypothetical protein